MTAVDQDRSEVDRAVDAVRRTALVAFTEGAGWHEVLAAVSDARRIAQRVERAAAPQRQVKGCPSEAQYRRHLKAGEKCEPCRALVRRLEEERRERNPHWWVRGAGRPARGGAR